MRTVLMMLLLSFTGCIAPASAEAPVLTHNEQMVVMSQNFPVIKADLTEIKTLVKEGTK